MIRRAILPCSSPELLVGSCPEQTSSLEPPSVIPFHDRKTWCVHLVESCEVPLIIGFITEYSCERVWTEVFAVLGFLLNV